VLVIREGATGDSDALPISYHKFTTAYTADGHELFVSFPNGVLAVL